MNGMVGLLLLLLCVPCESFLQGGPARAATRGRAGRGGLLRAQDAGATPDVVRVCSKSKDCSRKGSARVLKIFKELAEGTDVQIEEIECLGECGMGPNVEVRNKIINRIKSKADVANVLGVDLPAEQEA